MHPIVRMIRARLGTLLSATVLALVVASTALAGSGVGGTFQLGAFNRVSGAGSVTGTTSLVGTPTLSNPQLRIRNNGDGAALDLQVDSVRPALTVNSSARIPNLNADLIDGLDASQLLRSTGKAVDADKLDGLDSGAFVRAATPLAWHAVRRHVLTNDSATEYGEWLEPGEFYCARPQGGGASCDKEAVNYDAAVYSNVAYAKDDAGIVHVKGVAKAIGYRIGSVFRLPVGFRPTRTVLYTTEMAGPAGYLTVTPDGDVKNHDQDGYVDLVDGVILDGLSFPVDVP